MECTGRDCLRTFKLGRIHDPGRTAGLCADGKRRGLSGVVREPSFHSAPRRPIAGRAFCRRRRQCQHTRAYFVHGIHAFALFGRSDCDRLLRAASFGEHRLRELVGKLAAIAIHPRLVHRDHGLSGHLGGVDAAEAIHSILGHSGFGIDRLLGIEIEKNLVERGGLMGAWQSGMDRPVHQKFRVRRQGSPNCVLRCVIGRTYLSIVATI